MDKVCRDYLIIIGLIVLIFIPLFIRPEVIGIADTYYYLNFIWGKSETMRVSLPIIQGFFSVIPASFLLIKTLMLLITVFCAITFYKTCKLITDNATLLTVLLLIFTPFSKIFLTFETSTFGLPFMFLSIYFVMRYKLKEDKKLFDFDIMFSLMALFFSVIFWRFTVYYIPIFLFMTGFHAFYILATLLLIPFSYKLIFSARPNLVIVENRPFVGFWPMLLLLPAYFRKFNIVPVVLLSWLTFFNYKFIYLLVPIAILNIAPLLKDKLHQHTKFLLVFGFVALLLSMFIFSITMLPTNSFKDAFTLAKHRQKDLGQQVSINWSYGYYAIWNGIDVNYYGTYKPQEYKGFTLTYPKDPQVENCKEIEKKKEVWIYDC